MKIENLPTLDVNTMAMPESLTPANQIALIQAHAAGLPIYTISSYARRQPKLSFEYLTRLAATASFDFRDNIYFHVPDADLLAFLRTLWLGRFYNTTGNTEYRVHGARDLDKAYVYELKLFFERVSPALDVAAGKYAAPLPYTAEQTETINGFLKANGLPGFNAQGAA